MRYNYDKKKIITSTLLSASLVASSVPVSAFKDSLLWFPGYGSFRAQGVSFNVFTQFIKRLGNNSPTPTPNPKPYFTHLSTANKHLYEEYCSLVYEPLLALFMYYTSNFTFRFGDVYGNYHFYIFESQSQLRSIASRLLILFDTADIIFSFIKGNENEVPPERITPYLQSCAQINAEINRIKETLQGLQPNATKPTLSDLFSGRCVDTHLAD